jgi:2-amino-4-hydroxy-6-hydroxymethyldihydropteridine diphosphokinase
MGRAFIGIGSNIEPEKNILMALRQLADSARLIAISRFYREPAIGRPNDPAFYNGVVSIETDLPPARLKEDVLRKIEAVLGRRRSSDKYAPRTIDLDLLLYNDYVDPDILERAFVAIPLSELDPDLVLPGSGLPIRQIANRFAAEEIEPLPEYTRLLRHQLLEGG